jgi:hypothetical protein
VVSSPLILGLNVTDKARLDSVWPILSNKEAIAVNKAWQVKSPPPPTHTHKHPQRNASQHCCIGPVINHSLAAQLPAADLSPRLPPRRAGHPGRFVMEGGPRSVKPWHCPAGQPAECCVDSKVRTHQTLSY